MNDEHIVVPYIVHEGEMARQERHLKRLTIILVVILCMLLGSNLAWLYIWNQYEYIDQSETTTTIDADQDGAGINIVGGEDIIYGPESKDSKEKENTSAPEEEER